MMHALMLTARMGRPFDTRLHVQLDNTCAENKNETIIAFLAWLVKEDIFVEAAIFCMIKGHTFTSLDQSFSTLITKMVYYAIATVPEMPRLMRDILVSYHILE
eukprot:738673-Pleurochrysis_carterae.AAC.1